MAKFEAIYDEKNAEIPVKYNIEPLATIGDFFKYLETRVDCEVTVRVLVLNNTHSFDIIGYASYRNGGKAHGSTFSGFLDRKIIRIEGTKKGNTETVKLLAF